MLLRTLSLLLLTASPDAGVDEPTVRTLPKSGAGSLVRHCAAACPAQKVCVELEVHCIRAPCPPVKQCLSP